MDQTSIHLAPQKHFLFEKNSFATPETIIIIRCEPMERQSVGCGVGCDKRAMRRYTLVSLLKVCTKTSNLYCVYATSLGASVVSNRKYRSPVNSSSKTSNLPLHSLQSVQQPMLPFMKTSFLIIHKY